MNTCKTCKHWKRETNDFGECESPKIISSVRMNDSRKSLQEPDVFSFTGEYHSCGENFGCVHHQV